MWKNLFDESWKRPWAFLWSSKIKNGKTRPANKLLILLETTYNFCSSAGRRKQLEINSTEFWVPLSIVFSAILFSFFEFLRAYMFIFEYFVRIQDSSEEPSFCLKIEFISQIIFAVVTIHIRKVRLICLKLSEDFLVVPKTLTGSWGR